MCYHRLTDREFATLIGAAQIGRDTLRANGHPAPETGAVIRKLEGVVTPETVGLEFRTIEAGEEQ